MMGSEREDFLVRDDAKRRARNGACLREFTQGARSRHIAVADLSVTAHRGEWIET